MALWSTRLFVISKVRNQHGSCSPFYFTCLSSFLCIPYVKVCDGQTDCLHGEDEICEKKSVHEHVVNVHPPNTFTCNESNVTISAYFVDNFIPDCPNSIEDEMQYYILMTDPFHSKIPCNSDLELPCIPGHSHCFQLDKLCIFEFQYNTTKLKHCRNGAHLYNCTHFKCLNHFKCPKSYCIPFDSICNGKWDCPQGEDEVNCHSFFVQTCLNAKIKQNVYNLKRFVTIVMIVCLVMMRYGVHMTLCLCVQQNVNVFLKVLSARN